ncbi:DNA-binding protein HU [Bacteroidetes bacterium oral taxon 272 str. F0290]|nr:DNA-binding protein HU [Bacteroidetes bacterium oral taxon 272 str. F0290]
MIKYVVQAKKNPLKKEEVKFYPQAAPTTPVTLAQIIKRIEKRSTVSSADVKAVLDALQYEVIEALENGNTVRLGDIGSFRLTIKAEGCSNGRRSQDKRRKTHQAGERTVYQEYGHA